mgnify:FL=1
MAYETTNPVKKISQMGDSNALWYYTDGDAIGTIDNADYFLNSGVHDLTAGDIIFINSGGSNAVVDILIVSAATTATVTTVILA